MSEHRKTEVLNCCEQLGIPIVEDDPFSLTAMEGTAPPPLKMLDRSGTVLYIGSLSKIAASGLRIGWMAAPQTVIKRLSDARQQMDFGLSIFPQWIASQLLSSGRLSPYLESLQERLLIRRDILASALDKKLSGMIEFHLPKGGLNLWCKIHEPVNDFKLLENGMSQGVLFVPGSVYGSEPGYVRLTYARPALDELEPGAERFSEALRLTLSGR